MTKKIYKGVRVDGELKVTVNGKPLDPRYDIHDFSPNDHRFECAHGDGPCSQLSLALIADHTGDKDEAKKYVLPFKWTYVATSLDRTGFEITSENIEKHYRNNIASYPKLARLPVYPLSKDDDLRVAA